MRRLFLFSGCARRLTTPRVVDSRRRDAVFTGGLEPGQGAHPTPGQLSPVLRVRARLQRQVPDARHRLRRPLLEPEDVGMRSDEPEEQRRQLQGCQAQGVAPTGDRR